MWESILAILGKTSVDAVFGVADKRSRGKGLVADFIDELKKNTLLCELVLKHSADPKEEGKKLGREAYRALRSQGYNFAKIKKGEVPSYVSIQGTDVAFLSGKTLDEAMTNISDRIHELQTICDSSASLERIDFKRRFNNLAKRFAVVARFLGTK
jgi:hypothetical protein